MIFITTKSIAQSSFSLLTSSIIIILFIKFLIKVINISSLINLLIEHTNNL